MKTVRFQNTEQHLVWISMLENNIYRSNEEFPKSHSVSWSQKAQFFFSHNSHCVWEWSIVNSKINFVAWKNFMLIVFLNEYYLAYLLLVLSPKSSISMGM